MSGPVKTPEQILAELGIKEPEDLDIEAIAEYCCATIRYKPLYGCEARIIGYRDRAIVTINQNSYRGRQRFSGGHGLGRWVCDRGQVAFGCDYANLVSGCGAVSREERAKRFPSDPLRPPSTVRPRARG